MQHVYAVWTWSMEKKHAHVAWTNSMDMQHGKAAWTCGIDMRLGHAARTCSIELQIYISKTCSKDIRFSIGLGMQRGHSARNAARTFSRECSMDMQHRNRVWTFSMYTLHGHTEWRNSMNVVWTCSFEMQLGHAARICSMDKQGGHAGWTCCMNIQQGHTT
jgi:hypothetical protein